MCVSGEDGILVDDDDIRIQAVAEINLLQQCGGHGGEMIVK